MIEFVTSFSLKSTLRRASLTAPPQTDIIVEQKIVLLKNKLLLERFLLFNCSVQTLAVVLGARLEKFNFKFTQ